MAHETFCSDGYLAYLGQHDSLVSYSEEQCMLMQWCYRLASTCNFADESPKDVTETRKQAKLLMNLMHSNSTIKINSSCSDNDVVVNSALERSTSDQSFTSYHTTHSTKKRDRFSFTCPSLSLESSTSQSYFNDVEREVSGMHSQGSIESEHLPQAAHLLLGRSLKVDDPDALRLSADAMARNVLQSFQKAMHWRIHAWIYVLSKKIVYCEHQMLASGATIEDLKTLLLTPEAKLIVALQQLAQDRGLAAESAITSFEVLSQRIENYEEKDAHCCHRSRVTCDSSRSSSSSSSLTSSSDEVTSLSDHCSITDTMGSHSSETYSYVVAHELQFSCTVHLQTLVGFTEIAIAVPGTVAGSFESSELDSTAQLKSVTVDLDTNALASLIDKACRAVVRSSVEKVITQPTETTQSKDCSLNEDQDTAVHDADAADIAMTPEVSSFTLTSPPMSSADVDDRAPATRSAFVTPGPNHSDDMYHTAAPTNLLIPIPDDLKGGSKQTNKDTPRRISPQPTTSSRRHYLRTGSTNSDDSLSEMNGAIVGTRSSTASLKRRTPPPLTLEEDDDTSKCDDSIIHQSHAAMTAQRNTTNVQFLRQRRSLPSLISPPGGYAAQNKIQFFHGHVENGPSLPMLVEAACQVATRSSIYDDTNTAYNA